MCQCCSRYRLNDLRGGSTNNGDVRSKPHSLAGMAPVDGVATLRKRPASTTAGTVMKLDATGLHFETSIVCEALELGTAWQAEPINKVAHSSCLSPAMGCHGCAHGRTQQAARHRWQGLAVIGWRGLAHPDTQDNRQHFIASATTQTTKKSLPWCMAAVCSMPELVYW